MTTLGTMEDRIADELGRNDLKSQTRLEIKSAIAFYQSYRTWHNESRIATSLTTTSITAFYSIPARFVGQIDTVRITDSSGNNELLNPRTYDWIDAIQTGSSTDNGEPSDYCVYGNQIRFYPTPDGEYTVTLSGVTKETSTLTSTACSNWWTEETLPAEAVRHRAKAALMINYLGDQMAKQEMMGLAQAGKPFLSVMEMIAFDQIEKITRGKISTGFVDPEAI